MEFLQNNWFWIVLIVFFVWMHSSGMGCGGHGGHGSEEEEKKKKEAGGGGGHQH